MKPAKRKAVRLCKNRTAFKNNNIKNTVNATNFIATGARQASAKAAFRAEIMTGTAGPALAQQTQPNAKADVSDVSDVQAPIHAGLRCNVTATADVSDVSAKDFRPCKRRTTKAHFADSGAAFLHQLDRHINRRPFRAVRRCDTVNPGARHTTRSAGNLPDSEVFSRSEFEAALMHQVSHGYGAGSAYPQGRQHD